jgi:outer membrane protein assembly factor BamB
MSCSNPRERVLLRNVIVLLAITPFLCLPLCLPVSAQGRNEHDWHISPTQINLLQGDTASLEILDSGAHALHGANWDVDNPSLAEITTKENGDVALTAKATGTVRVTATRAGEVRQTEIKIWPGENLPVGTVKWSIVPLGRTADMVAAYPTGDSDVDIYAVDQDGQHTHIRGFSASGMQRSLLTLPESTSKVEIICGDNLGGVIVASIHPGSYMVYSVSADSKVRWHHFFQGIWRGHALSAEGLLHLLTQSADTFKATITALDETTGEQKFSLPLPGSHELNLNLRATRDGIICVPGKQPAHPLAILPSNLFINIDGDAYAAFTVMEATVGVDQCDAGAAIDPVKVYYSTDDNLMLWRIHPDGSYQATTIDKYTIEHAPAGTPTKVILPTGAIIPDGLGGVLLSVRWMPSKVMQNIPPEPDEFVYGITAEGGVAYKLPLPHYKGKLHDGMVLGEEESGFVTRGNIVIKFNVRTGAELWERDLDGPLEIMAALADGGVIVKKMSGESIRVQAPEKN